MASLIAIYGPRTTILVTMPDGVYELFLQDDTRAASHTGQHTCVLRAPGEEKEKDKRGNSPRVGERRGPLTPAPFAGN